jgi:type I restriction enzyme S subunit
MSTRTIPFGSVAQFRNGINYLAADAGDTVKVVGVGDFRDRLTLSTFGELSTVTIGGVLAAEDELRDGDLLLVRSNGSKDLVGRCLLVKNPPRGITFSGFTIRVRVDASVVIPEFVALVFQGGSLKNRLLLAGGGNGNIANLSQGLLREVELPVPSIASQRAILAATSVGAGH